MTTLNRNNSNWSFEERRKINENWDILEGLANSTASGNNGLKSEVDQLKITVGQNTNRITNSLQLINQADFKADNAVSTANQANSTANSAISTANNANSKANNAVSTANEANSKANNAVSTANEANSKANSAVSTASRIDSKVENAVSTANQANFKSDNAVLTANEANEKSEYVQSQLDSVVTNGDSSAEVVQARKGKTTLRERLDDEYNAVTSQLEQVEKNFKSTTEEEAPEFGAELLGASGWTSSGWTGDFTGGFRHTLGSTLPLIYPVVTEVGKIYRVSLTLTNVSPNGARNEFGVSIGGSVPFEIYKGEFEKVAFTYGIEALSNSGGLVITPIAEYEGVISDISVKELLTSIKPTLIIKDSNNNNALEIRAGLQQKDNVFIGVSSGENTFEGYGNVGIGDKALSKNTDGFWNTAVGKDVMENNTTGTRNVALGYIALRDNTSGDRNVAIGTFALTRNTLGRNNIALGADALEYNTTGNNNIALSNAALDKNTTGSDNIALGYYSLYANERGGNNVALGRLALVTNVAGDHNIAIGMHSMYRNTLGRKNIGLGGYSLENNLTGENNVALGYNANKKNTTGNNNVAMSENALSENLTGSDNVALGKDALSKNATGSGNVAIGFNSGGAGGVRGEIRYNVAIGQNAASKLSDGASSNIAIGLNTGLNNLRTGSNNILIGSSVDVPASDTSNYLNIANTIYGDLTRQLIGIRKSTPTAIFHVLGGNAAVPGFKLDSGVLTNTPQAGALEFNNGKLYFSTAEGTRKEIQFVS